jgi:hypothetical protein
LTGSLGCRGAVVNPIVMSASAKAEFKRMHPYGMTLPCEKLLDTHLAMLPRMPYGSADKWQLYHEGKDTVSEMCTCMQNFFDYRIAHTT